MGERIGRDGDLGPLGQDHFPGQSGPWVSDQTRKEFYDSVEGFKAAVVAWKTANVEARQAADALMSWAKVGEQALAVAKPIIDAELAKRSATPQDAAKTTGLQDGVKKVKDILAAIRPLLGSTPATGG